MAALSQSNPAPAKALPVARRLAAFAHRLHHDDLPATVRARALDLILDALGVALAANRYPFAERILTGIRDMSGPGACAVIGRGERLPLRDAVLMNGALIHGLDFDDTHMKSVVHATAASLPAGLGVAEHVGASGRELIAAYVCGVEVAIRLGLAKPFGLHEHGYHATGVVAHFASALVAGKLMGLDEDALAHAQGITGSTAMASQEFAEDGAWNKRLHPGWGAVAGIVAAHMARAGFKATARPYEGRYGIFNMHLGKDAGVEFDAIGAGLGERYELLACAVKPYPACHFTHAIADAALALRAKGIAARDIERMRVLIPTETLPVIAEPLASKQRPRSEYEAKFSAPYVAAAAFVRGGFGLRELEPASLEDPEILALAARIECAPDPASAFPRYFSGGIEVTTRDGVTRRHHEPINRGAGERALGAEEIEAKFMAAAALWVAPEKARAIRDAVRALPSLGAGEFMRVLAG